ncbi:hypothetical protein [Ruania alba]|uniref:Uncharacterized protein n=1 Tax=Ruania alba TaxID=648782 RepID=A0A1H5N9K2_9MICO|nr:hypothetical protein [Ruania alba]SEE98312.1 hypothetical protein SAMN04488554_4104 [Ruania alba]
MRSKKYQIALAALTAPALLTAVFALLGHPWIPEVGLAALLLMIAVISLDTNRRTRSRFAARTKPEPRATPGVSPDDLMGTVRLLQAQYVGRLDRSQAALEEAAAALLAAAERPADSPGSPHPEAATAPRRDPLHTA